MKNNKTFKTVVLEDGACAVVRTDPSEPQIFEVVATFYDASGAREYADMKNSQNGEQRELAPAAKPHIEPAAASEETIVKPNGASPELTERQTAVLEALRAKANSGNLVEVKAAVLAEAANIPLGSLHSVLQSLEKKQRILTARPGSPRAPAAYQIL